MSLSAADTAGRVWTAPPRPRGPLVQVLTIRADGRVVICTAQARRDAGTRSLIGWVPTGAGETVIGIVDWTDPHAWTSAARLAERAGYRLGGHWTLAGRFPAVQVRPT